ncbi:23S rRNA (guanosine(2251)-2'-O)-methyltransferase RlmB [Ideonella livida]|uniref:23S rRNA (guanosine-2'-O-)-methyltransferase RlmB n=1 Tax=Ideonella livida TaxID=2707176 RepID=A0A7C9TJ13_9BURK|nr:23S rRNA (guanosine(2251)-2'-O)-methyltransferase RlmB [Ideonella livida]NDY90842.1 23S rRNA (guanosine(2251)-2'-O)-methyltransferase RlmB [Ideonella livida]
MSTRVLYGFHAVFTRLKMAPETLLEVHIDATRRDARMRTFVERVKEAGRPLVESDDARLTRFSGGPRHQGVAAKVAPLPARYSLDEIMEEVEAAKADAPLVLALDGVTDPHNLGACLRVADGAGAQAVIAPKDHAAGVNATVAKVASGAAESVPYLMVTNLARSLGELKERGITVIGTSDDAEKTLYDVDLTGPVALVLGAEGAGMRPVTRKACDHLVRIPMSGVVESLNVSVAAAVCLYEARRQRLAALPAAGQDPVEEGAEAPDAAGTATGATADAATGDA